METELNGSRGRLDALLTMVFVVILVGSGIDLWLDQPETLLSAHVFFELMLMLFSLVAAGYLGSGWYRSMQEVREITAVAGQREAERDAWRERAALALEGLGEAVQAQFDAWHLTPAETETALMLLKGYSHKRIGRLTDRSERTVRQHAVAVYRKAGLSNRSQLAAFFLDDLLLPQEEGRGEPGREPLVEGVPDRSLRK